MVGRSGVRLEGGPALPRKQRERLRKVLQRQRQANARRADMWGLSELAAIPTTLLDALGTVMEIWEHIRGLAGGCASRDFP